MASFNVLNHFRDLSGNLERLYAVCVYRKTLNPEQNSPSWWWVGGTGKSCRRFDLVTQFWPVQQLSSRHTQHPEYQSIATIPRQKGLLRLSLDLAAITLLYRV